MKISLLRRCLVTRDVILAIATLRCLTSDLSILFYLFYAPVLQAVLLSML